MRPVRVHIERLVIPVSMRGDSEAISRQVQAQVAQHLAATGNRAGSEPAGDTRSIARLDGETVGANPTAIGRAAARAIKQGLDR